MSIKDFLEETFEAKPTQTGWDPPYQVQTKHGDYYRIKINQNPKLLLLIYIFGDQYSFYTYMGASDIPIERFLDLLKDPVLKKKFLFNLDLFT